MAPPVRRRALACALALPGEPLSAVGPPFGGSLDFSVAQSVGQKTQAPGPAQSHRGESDLSLPALDGVPAAKTTSDTPSSMTFTAVAQGPPGASHSGGALIGL